MNHPIQYLAAAALAMSAAGCELIFSPDRSKIPPSCHDCACTQLSSAGGCADKCDMALESTMSPDLCNGASASSACSACILESCGESDPAACQ